MRAASMRVASGHAVGYAASGRAASGASEHQGASRCTALQRARRDVAGIIADWPCFIAFFSQKLNNSAQSNE
jgi:hypothetical protein